MIDVHEKVCSADQTAWVELIEVMRNNLLRLAVSPKLQPEEIGMILNLMVAGKNLHISLLAFDEELEHYRNSTCNTSGHQCGGGK